jgi:hypothetical protein
MSPTFPLILYRLELFLLMGHVDETRRPSDEMAQTCFAFLDGMSISIVHPDFNFVEAARLVALVDCSDSNAVRNLLTDGTEHIIRPQLVKLHNVQIFPTSPLASAQIDRILPFGQYGITKKAVRNHRKVVEVHISVVYVIDARQVVKHFPKLVDGVKRAQRYV